MLYLKSCFIKNRVYYLKHPHPVSEYQLRPWDLQRSFGVCCSFLRFALVSFVRCETTTRRARPFYSHSGTYMFCSRSASNVINLRRVIYIRSGSAKGPRVKVYIVNARPTSFIVNLFMTYWESPPLYKMYTWSRCGRYYEQRPCGVETYDRLWLGWPKFVRTECNLCAGCIGLGTFFSLLHPDPFTGLGGHY